MHNYRDGVCPGSSLLAFSKSSSQTCGRLENEKVSSHL